MVLYFLFFYVTIAYGDRVVTEGRFFCYTRYRQTPNALQRVKPTPSGANHLLYSCAFFKFCRFSKNKIQRTLQRISFLSVFAMLP